MHRAAARQSLQHYSQMRVAVPLVVWPIVLIESSEFSRQKARAFAILRILASLPGIFTPLLRADRLQYLCSTMDNYQRRERRGACVGQTPLG